MNKSSKSNVSFLLASSLVAVQILETDMNTGRVPRNCYCPHPSWYDFSVTV